MQGIAGPVHEVGDACNKKSGAPSSWKLFLNNAPITSATKLSVNGFGDRVESMRITAVLSPHGAISWSSIASTVVETVSRSAGWATD